MQGALTGLRLPPGPDTMSCSDSVIPCCNRGVSERLIFCEVQRCQKMREEQSCMHNLADRASANCSSGLFDRHDEASKENRDGIRFLLRSYLVCTERGRCNAVGPALCEGQR